MATKSLDPQQAERARRVLQRLLAERYGGNQSAMADALKMKQPTLWAVINGRKGVGGRMLSLIYAAHPAEHGEIMGGPQLYQVGDGTALKVSENVAVTAQHVVDTKRLAEEAVDMLVEIDGMSRAEAAERMLGIALDPPTVRGYYAAARLKGAPRTRPDELEAPAPKRTKR